MGAVSSLFALTWHLGASAQTSTPPGRIAFGRDGNIWVWQNGESTQLFEDGRASDPQWSPGGDQLLFVRRGDSYSDLVLRYLGSGEEAQLTYNQPDRQIGTFEYAANSVWAINPAWSSSGLIAYASDYFTAGGIMTLWLIADFSIGPEQALSAQDEGSLDNVTLSTDGSIAGYTVRYTVEAKSRTYVALRDLTDGIAYELADEPHGVFDPAISPNDRDVAVVIRSAAGVTDVWIVNRGTADRRRVTAGANASAPCWSPDGKWLAYIRMVDFEFEIWAMPVQGESFGEPLKLARYRDIDAPGGLAWTYEGG